MLRKAHRSPTGLGLVLLAGWGVAACGAFGTSAPDPERPPAGDAAPEATAPAVEASAAPPADAAPDATPDAPGPRFVGTATTVTLPPAVAYARVADLRTFALLASGGATQAVAIVDPSGLAGKRWRSEAPGLALAMLTTTSREGEVQDGLAAVIIEDNSTRRMRIGDGHNGRGLTGNVVAAAGNFVFVGDDTAITQAEVDDRLDVVDGSPRVVLTAGAREPFAVSTAGSLLLRRVPGADAVDLYRRASTQDGFGPPARTAFAPSPEGLQLVAVSVSGDTFVAAARCVPNLAAKCLWTFVRR